MTVSVGALFMEKEVEDYIQSLYSKKKKANKHIYNLTESQINSICATFFITVFVVAMVVAGILILILCIKQ